MNLYNLRPCRWIAILLTVTFLPTTAFATLGERETSVYEDGAAFKATTVTTVTSHYKTHQVKSAPQTVYEYENDDGVVFEVTWQGFTRPNLQQLFGSYYVDWNGAEANRPKGYGRQNTRVQSKNLVVEHGGHMRDIHGRAYLLNLVPPGVDPESLP